MPDRQPLKPQWLNSRHSGSHGSPWGVQSTAFRKVVLGPRPLLCCGFKVNAEERGNVRCWTSCSWVRPGGNIHRLCPPAIGQTRQWPHLVARKGGGECHSPQPGSPSQITVSGLEKGWGSLDTGHPCLQGTKSSCYPHLLLQVCLQSLSHPPSWNLGEQVASADRYKD